MTFENDFVHVEMFCIKKDTKIEPAWRFLFHLIPFREKQDGELIVGFRHKSWFTSLPPKKSIEEASVQPANPQEWFQERCIGTGFPLPAFSLR